MLKWLLVIGVVAVIYFLLIKKSSPAVSGPKKRAEKSDDDTMVPCETCGTFVSVKEAFLKEGRYYCSKACMEEE